MLKKLENIVNFFPLIFIFLTTLGYIHLQVFYYYFDIEILNYLDLTEIILLFFNKSILLVVGILIIIFSSYILENRVNNVTIKEKDLSENNLSSKILDKFAYLIIFLQILYIFIVVLSGNYIGLIYPIGFIICTIIYFMSEKYAFKNLFLNYRTFYFFSFNIGIVAFFLINLTTITSSIENGYNIRYNNKVLKQVYFRHNSKIVKTSKEIIYIGETKNNIFFFNSKTKETIIYKKENIDILSVKNY